MRFEPPRDLSATAHARIRHGIALIPVALWLVEGWRRLLVSLPAVEPLRDFVYFYMQGVVGLRHDAAAAYDMTAQAALYPLVVPGAHPARYPPLHPPQVAAFFSLFARLTYLNALYVWLALTIAAYGVCMYALWRVCPQLRARPWTVVLLVAAAPALLLDLSFGQIAAASLVCFTAAFFALRASRPFLAGLALGSLAFKPQIGLAAGVVFLCAAEWRVVLGGLVAAVAQMAAGFAYWGSVIVDPYLGSVRRLLTVVDGMEAHKYDMHSLRAFFDLLLPERAAMAMYAITAVAVLAIAVRCWRAGGALSLRYSVLLLATALVDPHLFGYDLVVVLPALMLLWDVAAQPLTSNPQSRTTNPKSLIPNPKSLITNPWFVPLLYFCYLSPLFTSVAEIARIQLSVPATALLMVLAADALRATRSADHCLSGAAVPDRVAAS